MLTTGTWISSQKYYENIWLRVVLLILLQPLSLLSCNERSRLSLTPSRGRYFIRQGNTVKTRRVKLWACDLNSYFAVDSVYSRTVAGVANASSTNRLATRYSFGNQESRWDCRHELISDSWISRSLFTLAALPVIAPWTIYLKCG